MSQANMMESDALPAALLSPDLAVQRSRVTRIGRAALATPGARLTGLLLLIFASAFARWFVSGVAADKAREEVSPFVYTMR